MARRAQPLKTRARVPKVQPATVARPVTVTSIQGQAQAKDERGRHESFDIRATITDMPIDFVQCRDYGHAWRPHNSVWNQQERCYNTSQRCSRCKTIRERDIGQAGQLVRNRYDYRDGYIIAGMGRLDVSDRDMIRLASVLRGGNLTTEQAAQG
jgi:hypothetical protein